MMGITKVICISLAVSPVLVSYAQDMSVHEQQLMATYSLWTENTGTLVDEQTASLDNEFSNKLTNLIVQDDQSFTYPFAAMRESGALEVIESADGVFRVYNWSKFSLASMREFYAIYQFKANEGIISVYAKQEEDSACIASTYDLVSALHTIAFGDLTYYLMVSNTILSNNDVTQHIECMRVEDNELVREVPLFRTRTKTFGKISFNFLRSSLGAAGPGVDDERDPFNLIVFDRVNKQILIPVVNEEMQVKKSYLMYQLNGEKFDYKGIKK